MLFLKELILSEQIFQSIILKLKNPWVVIGFLGQFFFFGRFIVQWIASEKKGRSIIPTTFWYFSVIGGLLLLAYALSIGDIVFSLGSFLNLFIYFRNIVLIRKNKHESIV
jgi:lipid-A-disaccharide synthase-like uncharacterized protein